MRPDAFDESEKYSRGLSRKTSNCGNLGAGGGGSGSLSSKVKLTMPLNEVLGVEMHLITDDSLDGPENDSICDNRLEICLLRFAVRRHPSPSAQRVASRVLTRIETLFRIESVCSTISSFPEKSRPPGSPASSLLDDDKDTDPQSPEGFVEFFLWLRFLLWIRFFSKLLMWRA